MDDKGVGGRYEGLREKGSGGSGAGSLAGSFAALRMTAKTGNGKDRQGTGNEQATARAGNGRTGNGQDR